MMKGGFVLLVLCLAWSKAFADTEMADEDHYLYDEDLFKETTAVDPHMIMFFAPWCGHCTRLKPVWNQLADYYNIENPGQITIAKVDCTAETKLCSDIGVTGYPTLKFFRPDEEAVRYKGARDLESLKEFISSTLEEANAEEEGPEVNAGLFELNDDNFKAHISSGTHFVKFFAPWCGHCRKMEPAWKELAVRFEKGDTVKIGRIDCTKSKDTCNRNDVKGYPTLLWFKDGNLFGPYQGSRQLEEFVSYVEKMTKPQTEEVVDDDKEVIDDEQPQEEVAMNEGLYELTKENFDGLTATGDFFVKFFAPWCGHCKRMEPAWKDLAKTYADDSKVRIGRVDCTQHSSVCQSKNVRGYPTLKYFRDGEEIEGSPGGRDFENLKAFVEKMSGDEKEPQKDEEQQEELEEEPEPRGALALDDDSFDRTIASGVTFVKFYAPWCGHCKHLAPTWDNLAEENFEDASKEIIIAKVDCTQYKSLCKEYEVKGYPTLKLFIDGEEIVKYSGARTLEALKAFVLETADKEGAKKSHKEEL